MLVPVLLGAASLPLHAAAQTPRLLADINRTPALPASSSPERLGFSGPLLFFAAYAPETGVELYRSSGTAAGTVLVRDLQPGPMSSLPLGFAPVAGGATVFLTVGDFRDQRSHLWRTDGTATGTVALVELGLSTRAEDLWGAFPFQGFAVFGYRNTLYRTDGTVAGTSVLSSTVPLPGPRVHAAERNGTLWINTGAGLVRTDGTPAGTVSFGPVDVLQGPIAVLGSSLLFTTPAALWRTDGTVTGTTMLFTGSLRGGVVAAGNQAFCLTDTALVRSDGTAAGTGPVRTFVSTGLPLAADSSGWAWFAADDGQNGNELWRSDGTTAGTYLVSDVTPGPVPTVFGELGVAGSRIAFMTWLGPLRRFLWVSDGSAAGTVQIPNAGALGSSQVWFTTDRAGTRVFFAGTDAVTGCELWSSDGTLAGTHLVSDLLATGPRTGSSRPAGYLELPGLTLFWADDGVAGRELWGTDGTTAGTRMVKDIWPGSTGSVSSTSTPGGPTGVVVAGVAYFAAADPTGGNELWRSDGTAAGTARVADLTAGTGGSHPTWFTALDERRFVFNTMSGFFVSDGSAAGTLLLAPTPVVAPTRLGQSVLFNFRTAISGAELWRTDGTVAGTVLINDLVPGFASSNPGGLVALGGHMYFWTDVQAPNAGLWRTDGTVSGTTLVAPLRNPRQTLDAANGRLYFVYDDGQHGDEPWTSDGTAGGTGLLMDLVPGAGSGMNVGRFTGLQQGVLFTDAHGGLWRTDGTAISTRQIAPPMALPASAPLTSARHAWLERVDGLWRSDATAAGTARLLTSTRFTGGSGAGCRRGHRVLVGHDDGIAGDELWLLDEAAMVARTGTGCGAALRVPELEATDPVLGAVLSLRMQRALPGAVAAVLAGGLPAAPLLVPGTACALHVGPLLLTLPATSLGSQWIVDLAVPLAPDLLGVRLGAQAVSFPGSTPLGLDLSNGLALTPGR